MSAESEQPSRTDSRPEFLIAGVGASAGGLQALEDFFRDMPAQTGIAFVVIQHLSPDYKSLMVELLGRRTETHVLRAENGMLVEPNHVYLIPPKKNMRLVDGHLSLTDQPAERGVNLPIDIFFRSLAADVEERAVGIVLSGTGSDGTLGIRAIKGAGGLVLVQDPTTAKFDGMPRSAIASQQVDFVLPTEQLRDRLLQYVNHPGFQSADSSTAQMAERTALEEAMSIVQARHDLDFSVYRRSTVLRRVQKRMQMTQVRDLRTYVDVLRRNPKEVTALFQDALIGVTRFYRDPDAFEALREPLLQILADRQGQEVRMWVQACSTGEEAYSMAILAHELIADLPGTRLKIFATDVDPVALRFASAGVYPATISADVPRQRLERYFRHEGDSYTIKEEIRKHVIFSQHNVLRDPPFNRMDVVTCRNFLIYLEPVAQQRVLSLFGFSLDKGGLLFLGPSESLGDLSREFEPVSHRWKIYLRRTSRSHRALEPASWVGRSQVARDRIHAQAPIGGAPSQQDRRLFHLLMGEMAPPSLVVDDTGRVLMTYGLVGKYLSVQPGKMTQDISGLVRGSLQVVLSTALHRARSEKARVVYPNVATDLPAPHDKVNVVVSPLSHDAHVGQLFGVVFREEDERGLVSDADAIHLPPDQTLLDLQLELQYTKESLQATIEELETSNEELQATNEELLSSNEELQSTNEELQSVNEELVTVNAEHQQKIEELTELNSDLDNFFLSSDSGTLFLDYQLKIRKFSPAVATHFNLLPTDIGRPLNHFTFGLDYPRFFEEARGVLETLEPMEREVANKEGRWILVRMLPYRRRDNQVGGLVISFVDTTEHRQATDDLVAFRALMAKLRVDKQAELSKPRRVLLIEDDPDQSALLMASLNQSLVPTDVTAAFDGAGAMAALEHATVEDPGFDMILLDLGLPDVSGFDLLETLKNTPATQGVPVIIVSAEDDPAAIRRAYNMHASCFITKPAAAEQLPALLESVKDHWFTVAQLPGDQRAPVRDI